MKTVTGLQGQVSEYYKTFKEGTWVNMSSVNCKSADNCDWFDTIMSFTLDIPESSTITSIVGFLTTNAPTTYEWRWGRGYTENTSTQQYWYLSTLPVFYSKYSKSYYMSSGGVSATHNEHGYYMEVSGNKIRVIFDVNRLAAESSNNVYASGSATNSLATRGDTFYFNGDVYYT